MANKIDYSKWDPEMAARIKALMETDDNDENSESKPNLNSREGLENLKNEAKEWNWSGFVNSLNGVFAQLSLGSIRDVNYYVANNLADALGGPNHHQNDTFEEFYYGVKFDDYGGKNFSEALAHTIKNNKKNIKLVLSGLLKKFDLTDIFIGGQKISDIIERINPEFRFVDSPGRTDAKSVRKIEYKDSKLCSILKHLGDSGRFLDCIRAELPEIVSQERKKVLKSRIICDDNSVDTALDTLTEMHNTLTKMRAYIGKNGAVNPEDYNYIERKQGSSDIIKDLNNAIEIFNLVLTARLHNKTPRFSKQHKAEKTLRQSMVKDFLGRLAKAYDDAKDQKKVFTVPGVSENTLCRLFVMVLKQKHIYLPGINPYKNSFYTNINTKEQILKKTEELVKISEISGETEKMLVLLYLFFKVLGDNKEEFERAIEEYYKIWRKQKWKHRTATIFKLESDMKEVTLKALDLVEK